MRALVVEDDLDLARQMKETLERATAFPALRRDYPRRHAFVRHALPAAAVPARLRRQVVDGLGVRLT